VIGTNVFHEWFPLGVSIDLVEGDVSIVTDAVRAQIKRFTGSEEIEEFECHPTDWNALYRSVNSFTNVPTKFFCIPTKSRWTALWTNCFLCDGYDSLCYCLTSQHGLRTIHWKASDTPSMFQPGSTFCHRMIGSDGTLLERTVHCSQQDSKWEFHEIGAPLPEEDLSLYKTKLKKDRFSERIAIELLERLGAEPRNELFYDFSRPVRLIERRGYPDTIACENFDYIRMRVGQHKLLAGH